VIIVDHLGEIVYYNDAMSRIDDLPPADVVRQQVLDVYDLEETTSMILKCLNTRSPIIDRPFFYRTRMGRVANTVHSVFPLFKKDALRGAICFVREYSVLEETLSQVSQPRHKVSLCNETRFTFASMVGKAPEFLHAVNTAMMAASTPSPVMLYGETGTGKELFAQAIHNQSTRKTFKYTAINCAAIPENLLEGILFGTSRGAFTGAQDRAGLFERSSGGTLFLDELNSMALGLQAKILRVLQERKVRRLGSLKEVPVGLKIISSVNRQPHLVIAEKTLRPDLFYRLGVVFIPIPPLRERKGDIGRLVQHFMEKHSLALGRNHAGISPEVLALFNDYHWPGNVRELEHVIEGAMNLIGPGETIEMDHLRSHLPTWYRLKNQAVESETHLMDLLPEAPNGPAPDRPEFAPLAPGPRGKGLIQAQEEREIEVISRALRDSDGNVTRAAGSIGISRQLLHYKMKKHRISRADFT